MDFASAEYKLLDLFGSVLDFCDIGRAFDRCPLEDVIGSLRQTPGRIYIVAIGKSAPGMAEELIKRSAIAPFAGILASPVLNGWSHPRFQTFEGGHPMPNKESIDAARTTLSMMNGLTSKDSVIFLVSGGGSACFELPISATITLADLVEMNRVLISGELTIVETNTIRKHLSTVKGGRLAVAAAPAQQLTLYISDVPRGYPSFVASGPSMPDDSTIQDMKMLIRRHKLTSVLPDSIRALIRRDVVPETPKSEHAVFRTARWCKLLDNDDAITAAASFAEQSGWKPIVVEISDDTSARDAARTLTKRAEDKVNGLTGKPVAVISGGELISPVLGRGRGGRNQAFALECAEIIAGKRIAVLSAGTDGIDGNSSAAGAVADGTTLSRSLAAGLVLAKAREASDSSGFFDRLGDAIVTGPTGINVRDIRIVLAW
jgi:hydroxypyruvate reductase